MTEIFERLTPMKETAQKIFILIICVLMLMSGCEQQETTGVKKNRLIASENMKLKKDLKRLNVEIKKLKEQHNTQIKKKEKLLAQSIERAEAWRKKASQNVRNQVEGVVDAVMEQNVELREENKKLKAEIEQLKAQVQQLSSK